MTKEFTLPELAENITSGTVARVLVTANDAISAGQNVIEIETDKAVAEIPCPWAGKVIEVRVKEGDTVNVGDVLLLLDENGGEEAVETPSPKPAVAPATKEPAPAEKKRATQNGEASDVRAAPSVRQLAREHDIPLDAIPTHDSSGRVTAQDVRDYIASQDSADADTVNGEATKPEEEAHKSDHDKWGAVVIEPMNAIRVKTAEHLTQCWTTIPHVTHFDKADITELDSFRKRYAREAEKADARLTITAFLIKMLPEVFQRFPRLNATVDMENQQFILKQYCHIGVAVDTPNGLVVPVLRHVNTKSVLEIAVEIALLAEKARARKLALEDMRGGGFTVSNLGGLGGHAFTPIINAPETAILGVSRAAMEPVYSGDAFEARLMLPLSLSYDHRCIDGADAARFLRYLCESIEHPWRLTLGL